MGSCNRLTSYILSVCAAEALVVVNGLLFIVDMGFNFVLLESDAYLVICKLQTNSEDLSDICVYTRKARDLVRLLAECQFAYLSKSRNRAAYVVAQVGMMKMSNLF